MITCARCGAKSQAALCRTHESDLRRMLQELAGTVNPQTGRSTAGWIENLADASTGQVRMGGDGGRKSRSDEAPIRFNDKASQLLQQVQGSLARWVQDICESRGIEYEPVRFERLGFIGPLQLGVLRGLHYTGGGAPLALWLEIHVGAVLASEDAGQLYEEMVVLVDSIKHLIDRPTPPRFFGVCPAPLDDAQRQRLRATGQQDRKICMTNLWGKPDQIEVQCGTCKRVHNGERVLRELVASLSDKHFTQAELIGYRSGASRVPGLMDQIGERVPERTFQKWRKGGQLKPRGYRRANGRWGFAKRNEDDEPEFLLLEVLRLRDLEELAKQ